MPDDISADLVARIREQIQKEMVDLRITDFRAKADRDHDGDPIIRLQIAYDEKGPSPRPVQVSAVARHIRSVLEAQLPNTFPVFRFLTSRELADEAQ